jgi:hypothetical protein
VCAGNAAHPTICIQETLQPHGHNVSFLVLIHTNAILAPDSLQESMGENGAAAVIALGMIAGLVVPAPVRAERHFPPTTPGAYLIGQPRARVLGPPFQGTLHSFAADVQILHNARGGPACILYGT